MSSSPSRKGPGKWWENLKRKKNNRGCDNDKRCETQNATIQNFALNSHESKNGAHQLALADNDKKTRLEVDDPPLSEQEKQELVSLVKDKNISMDFILEMKEAFVLFDKVSLRLCIIRSNAI